MQSLTISHRSLDNAIDGWLLEKRTSKSGSAKTETAYRETLASFRETLQRGGLDLDSEDVHTLKDVATIWASVRKPGARFTGEVSPATYNQRLAILSSFYTYLQEQLSEQDCEYVNPIALVKKRKVQAYADAAPLDGDDLTERLQHINRDTLAGKRDYALLAIGLQTGRRASELVGLRMGDIKVSGNKVTLHFNHCKGGKKMRDALDPDTAAVFLDYVHAVYGAHLFTAEKDAPVWISLSPRNKGQAITMYTLIDTCVKHLGESKVHALRHTFAVEMEKAGAPISEISARLGHADEKITSRYLKQTRSAENPYAKKLSSRFAIGTRKEP